MLTPPLKINGIKTKLLPFIEQHLPENYKELVWHEPFMGSGIVGFNLAGETAIFSDSDPCIIKFYNDVKNSIVTPDSVKNYLIEAAGIESKQVEPNYYEIRKRFNQKQDSHDLLYLNRMCFNGVMRFNKHGEFNVPFCRDPTRLTASFIDRIVGYIRTISDKIDSNNWSFVTQDFEDSITSASSDGFIYCDPPYTGLNTQYYGPWFDSDDKMLHQCLKIYDGKWMVSNWIQYRNLTNHTISDIWGEHTIYTISHTYNVGGKAQKRPKVAEVIITNY